MKLAIMQPYFIPYIGYFQLIASVDKFVVYDNVKYTKKGWISRNRMLKNGEESLFSLPLRKDSDFLEVRERKLAIDFNRGKFLNQFMEAYRKAPFFELVFPLIERMVFYEDENLFRFLHHSITQTCEYLGISTPIEISSNIEINHALKGQDRVLAICKALGATAYVNAIGGMELYSKKEFERSDIDLSFIKPLSFEYRQFEYDFVAWLSIVDVMMFNPLNAVQVQVSSGFEIL